MLLKHAFLFPLQVIEVMSNTHYNVHYITIFHFLSILTKHFGFWLQFLDKYLYFCEQIIASNNRDWLFKLKIVILIRCLNYWFNKLKRISQHHQLRKLNLE